MTVATLGPARPGRQRSAAVDAAILDATLQILGERGYGDLTVSAVIGRAGVSSATLYRRWETKQQLVAAALASLDPGVGEIDTGSFDGDVEALVHAVADALSVRNAPFSEDLAIELRRNPELRAAVTERFVMPRVELLDTVLNRARARGEIGPGPSGRDSIGFVSGPLHHRVFVLGLEIDDLMLERTVRAACAALRAVNDPGEPTRTPIR